MWFRTRAGDESRYPKPKRGHSHPFFLHSCTAQAYVGVYETEEGDLRVHVLRVHVQVHVLWVRLSVGLGPMGQCLRSRECAAHSWFSPYCCGRSEGWEHRLLTTSPSHPTLHHRARHVWEDSTEAGGAQTPLLLNFTQYPCLLSSRFHFSFKFIVPLSLYLRHLFLLPSEWQRSLRFAEFVYFHEWVSDWMCSGGATEWLWNAVVREALGGEINTSGELHEIGLLSVVRVHFEGARRQRCGSSDLYLVV